MADWLPISKWLPRLSPSDVRADAIAGLTTAVMLIPQGMGYAMLAGLPPIVGLYAALVPLLTYALFGTSRQLAVGPVAMDSLLTAVAVSAIAESGSADYFAAAITLGALVGVIQFALGVLGLGFLVNFLSRPVLSGFMSAAALIIGASQLKYLLGVDLPRTHDVPSVLLAALEDVSSWHLATFALGLSSIVGLVALKRFAPKLPRAMVAVAVTTLLVYALGLDGQGVAIVGAIPPGLPAFALPRFETNTVTALAPAALTISLVAFVEAISVSKQFARLGRYEVNPGQELVALGLANVSGSLFGGYPITGGLSRTAVNAQAGARTPLSGVFTAATLALTLLVLTPLFFYMPKAVLAAIIMTAVLGLFDAAEPRRLWRVKRSDFWLLVFTFGATLGLGIQQGILTGVAASLGLFVVRTTRPHFAVLGRVPGAEAYLNTVRHPHAETTPGVLVLRIDAQFYFGNVSFLKDMLRRLEASSDESLHAVVIDASGINQLDSSALGALQEIDRDYAARSIRLLFAHVKGPVRDVMHRGGMLETLEAESRIFLRTHDAVLAANRTRAAAHDGTGAAPSDPRAPADRAGCGPPPRKA